MIAALIVALTILSSCTPNQTSDSNRSTDVNKSAARPASNTVTVSFAGMMVFHREASGPGYEVGIVIPDVAKEHVFAVLQDGIARQLPTGGRWRLSIMNLQTIPEHISPVELGHPKGGKPVRKPDDVKGQRDFSWIADLESPEFHGKELTLKKSGLLRPIIHLPNIPLYTLNKSMDLKRGQGGGEMTPFGFVAENMAMNIELHPGEELVLTDEDTHTPVFSLPYVLGQAPSAVRIENVRHPNAQASDFKMYYDLFSNVSDGEKFDFDENSKDAPYNPAPIHLAALRDQKFTCCWIDCDSILLGKRTKALE